MIAALLAPLAVAAGLATGQPSASPSGHRDHSSASASVERAHPSPSAQRGERAGEGGGDRDRPWPSAGDHRNHSSPSAQRGERSGEGGGRIGSRLARLAWDDDPPGGYDDGEPARPHVLLSVWAGEAFGGGGVGRSSSFLAGEAAWAFETLDLGLQGAAYRSLREGSREWTPVALLRITQRFRGRRGAELAFGFGLGAGRPTGWTAWYQVALGVRVPLGPLFLAGELAFEQYDLLRLGGGLGVAF